MDGIEGNVIVMEGSIKSDINDLRKNAAANDQKMQDDDRMFNNHKDVIVQLNLDLTAKAARLEAALTGADSAVSQGSRGEGG